MCVYVGFSVFNTKKYHVFAPMGRFQLELIYLYFPPSSYLILDGTTVENKGKLILALCLCIYGIEKPSCIYRTDISQFSCIDMNFSLP